MDPLLQGQLVHHGIELQMQVYSAQSVAVYKALYQGYNAAVKIITLEPNSDQKALDKEWQALKQLQHDNIVRLYADFWTEARGKWYLCLVLEWCEKDFYKDLNDRRRHQFPYEELELWRYLRQVVDALAFMQNQGAAHRDIKPQNLFLTSTGLKVGDFGSAKFSLAEIQRLTLTGTPYFLSPILKNGLVMRESQCIHNPFKSDAYSLGVTFLMLMTLEPTLVIVGASGDVSDSIRQRLNSTNYSMELQQCVNWMCAFKEEDRCDFLALYNYLNPPVPQPYEIEPQSDIPVVEEVKFEPGPELISIQGKTPNGDEKKAPMEEYMDVSGDEEQHICVMCAKELIPDSPDSVVHCGNFGEKKHYCSRKCFNRAIPLEFLELWEKLKSLVWKRPAQV